MTRTDQLTLRVQAIMREAEDVTAFHLVAADRKPLPGFEAGAHLDVHVGTAGIRQYSLCNPSSSPTHYEIAVLKEPSSRGGSRFMHEELAPGAELLASVPRNHFQLVDEVPVLLLAGGIGITPLYAMAGQLDQQHRTFELHYCCRSSDRAAFRTRLAQGFGSGHVHFHFDDGGDAQKLDLPAVLAQASPRHHLYVCGPAGFIEYVLDTATGSGWDGARLHREFFAAPAAPAAHVSDESFELVLARSGRTLTVPKSLSALAVLQAAGVHVDSSCETGVCGTCLTGVVEGTPDHRDLYLTDDEHARNDSFTPCCSRALTRTLVVDL